MAPENAAASMFTSKPSDNDEREKPKEVAVDSAPQDTSKELITDENDLATQPAAATIANNIQSEALGPVNGR